jgi:hypothetical protein
MLLSDFPACSQALSPLWTKLVLADFAARSYLWHVLWITLFLLPYAAHAEHLRHNRAHVPDAWQIAVRG